jgi:hypothetical protein
LHEKLVGQVFDAASAFQFAFDDGGDCGDQGGHQAGDRVMPVQPRHQYRVLTTRFLAQHEDVFLLDHAWTFDSLSSGERQLFSDPAVLARVADIVNAKAALAAAAGGGVGVTQSSHGGSVELADATLKELRWHTRAVKLKTTFDTDESDRGGTRAAAQGDGSGGAGGTRTYYYLLDELGTRFGQQEPGSSEDGPGFAFTVFCWAGSCYTLVWPVRDVLEGEEAERKAERPVHWPDPDLLQGEEDPQRANIGGGGGAAVANNLAEPREHVGLPSSQAALNDLD